MILNILEDIKIPAASSTSANASFYPESKDLPPPIPEKRGKKKGARTMLVNGVNRDLHPPVNREATPEVNGEEGKERWLPNFVKENFEGKQVR